MEPIELLSCLGCRRTVDQWTVGTGCVECSSKLFKQIKPTKFRIVCWFLNNPKHVCRLIAKDFREKWDESRR